jgi:hypothetical protein
VASGEGLQHFDRLVGSKEIRPSLEAGRISVVEWTRANEWAKRATPFLLYD